MTNTKNRFKLRNIAKWKNDDGDHWFELNHTKEDGYSYKTNGAFGYIPKCSNDREAIEYVIKHGLITYVGQDLSTHTMKRMHVI